MKNGKNIGTAAQPLAFRKTQGPALEWYRWLWRRYVPAERANELDVFDERDNLVEVLDHVPDLAVAHAAFEAGAAKYPDKRIFLREKARVIRRSDEQD